MKSLTFLGLLATSAIANAEADIPMNEETRRLDTEFTASAMQDLFQLSGGNPGIFNALIRLFTSAPGFGEFPGLGALNALTGGTPAAQPARAAKPAAPVPAPAAPAAETLGAPQAAEFSSAQVETPGSGRQIGGNIQFPGGNGSLFEVIGFKETELGGDFTVGTDDRSNLVGGVGGNVGGILTTLFGNTGGRGDAGLLGQIGPDGAIITIDSETALSGILAQLFSPLNGILGINNGPRSFSFGGNNQGLIFPGSNNISGSVGGFLSNIPLGGTLANAFTGFLSAEAEAEADFEAEEVEMTAASLRG